MEKFRVVVAMLLTAGLLLVSGGRAQAVIGIPDDVPGATLLYPFFKVDPTPTANSRQDSLVVVTNTANLSTTVHVTIWSVKSQHVYDFSVSLTEHDVWSCSLLNLLVNPSNFVRPCDGVLQAPIGVIGQLAIANGELLAGYVTVDVVTSPTSLFPGQAGYPFENWNTLIGHLYIVNLPAGSSSGFNAVSIESFIFPDGFTFGVGSALAAGFFGEGQPALPFSFSQIGFYLTRCLEEQAAANCAPFGVYGNRERIDGPGGDWWQTFGVVFPIASDADSTLALLTRYFSSPVLNGRSEVWLWKDRNTSGAAANVTLAVYDEDENVHSISFSLPDEVNFTTTAQIITPGAPGGWFRLRFPCGPFGFCGYDPSDPDTWGGGSSTPIQSVAYSLQFASEEAAELRWDAVFPAHRQYTNYIDGLD
jgi:hypothetical protein